MKMTLWKAVSAAVLLGPFAATVARGQASRDAKPNLAGAWTLNRDLSDAPGGGGYSPGSGDQSGGGQGHHGGYGGGGGHMGHGGMGGGGMSGGDGRASNSEQMAARRDMMHELMSAPVTLTVTETDDFVTFTEPDGHTVKYHTDGKKEAHQLTSGSIETKTRWDEGRLLIESDLGDGLKVTRTYSLAPDTHQLVVQIKPEGSRVSKGDRPPIKHVYDQASSSGS